MITLGIESTAHTFGIGIVSSRKKVLSNIRKTYATETGGMIPNEVSEHHLEICDKVIKEALKEANMPLKKVDLISFSQGPGIGHMLRIGALFARFLSLKNNIPLIGVNHCVAHLEIGSMLFKVKDPVLLYASGANTQIVAFEGKKYRIFGETLDIGIGNFLDSVAREFGLGFPGGLKIYELSLKGEKYIPLPYVVKGMDVSFGGLATNLKQKFRKGQYNIEDLAYSMQETAYAMLIEVAERALAHTGKTELLLGGGVACNKRLQQMAHIMCKERGATCFIPPNDLLVDNGAMIAWQGFIEYTAGGRQSISETGIRPYERTDDVDIFWK
jgi:N6-L-threonylcarbamoyladenine synthase